MSVLGSGGSHINEHTRGDAKPHNCSEGPWNERVVLDSWPTPYGDDTVARISCSCGRKYKRVTKDGPQGTQVKMLEQVETAAELVDRYYKPMESEEMVAKLKEQGWTFEGKNIVGPLELPDGQMMIDEAKWHVKEEERLNVIHKNRIFVKIIGAEAGIILLLSIAHLILGAAH